MQTWLQHPSNTRFIRRTQRIPGSRRDARLVLVTDMHARSDWFPRSRMRDLVHQINAVERVDCVVLGGDFVGEEPHAIEWAAQELAQLHAPAIAVLGNHDYWAGASMIADTLTSAGIDVLNNQAISLAALRRRDAQLQAAAHAHPPLWIAGLTSCWGGGPDVAAALAGTGGDPANTIVVGHEPALATLHDCFLHLAGHTHSGQIRIPVIAETITRRVYPRYSQPFPHGLYDRGAGRYVYTSAGAGYSTIALRLRCPAEFVVIDL